jgi:hypothetical protein
MSIFSLKRFAISFVLQNFCDYKNTDLFPVQIRIRKWDCVETSEICAKHKNPEIVFFRIGLEKCDSWYSLRTVFFNLLMFTAPCKTLKNLAAPQRAKKWLSVEH